MMKGHTTPMKLRFRMLLEWSFMRAIFPSALVLTVALAVAGCNGGGASSTSSNAGGVSLQQMQISPVAPSIADGTTTKLAVTGIYSDNSKADLTAKATWDSSNTKVATIGSAGASGVTVTSVAVGPTTISATVGGIKTNTTLTVTNANLVAIDINPGSPAIAAGTKVQLSATGRFSDGTHQDLTDQVSWQSSDTAVATVTPGAGLLSGAAAGSATVTATMGKVQGSAAVTVTNASLTAIRVEPSSPSIADGTVTQLTATGVFSDGSTQDLTGVATWSSTSAGVATVSNGGANAGLVASQSAGNATIKAVFNGMTGSTTVTVTPAVLTAIGITPVTGVLPAGVHEQLTAVGTFSDGSIQDITDQVTWASSQGSVATVGNASGSFGLVNALAVGNTAISATLAGVTAALPLSVSSAALVSINVSPTSHALADGTSLALTATGNYSDGSTLDLTGQVNWGTTDSTVAQVSNVAGDAGRVQAKAPGSVVISATLSQKTGTSRITVTSATLQSIDVTPADPSIAAGLRVSLKATGHYSDATTQDITGQVTWQTSDSAVVTVSNAPGAQGQAVTLAPGSATVTALIGSISGSTAVTVTNARLTAIQVTPSNPGLIKGTAVQLSAVGTYTDNSQQDLTSQVTWSASDSAVASVSNASADAGTVTGTGVGQSGITASLGSIQGTTTVSVSANPDSPVSLVAAASPNVILADGTDESTITVTVEPAEPSGAVADGTRVDFSIDQGSGQLSAASAVTANGVATVKLTTNSAGTIKVTATVDGTQVSNFAPVYATPDLSAAIGKVTFSVAPVINGMAQKGSVFSLFIYNLSNRSFDLTRYQMTDGSAVLNTVTDPATLNNGGHLLPGQGTGILFSLSQPEPNNGFTAAYSLRDQATGNTFDVAKTYVVN